MEQMTHYPERFLRIMQIGIIVLLASMLGVHFILNDELNTAVIVIMLFQLLLIGSVMLTGVYYAYKMSKDSFVGWLLLLTGATFAFLKIYIAPFVYDFLNIAGLLFFVFVPAPIMVIGLNKIARPGKIGVYVFAAFAVIKVSLEFWWFTVFRKFAEGASELKATLDLNYSIILVLDSLFAVFLVVGIPSALGEGGSLETYLQQSTSKGD